MENSKEIIINTNTVGLSFKEFYSTIKNIRDSIALTNDIEDKDINFKLFSNEIPIINLTVGNDGRLYIVITHSKFLQTQIDGPITFVLNSYEKLNMFAHSMKKISNTTFNTTLDPIDNAECVINTDGVITHVTYFDLNIENIGKKNIGKKDKSYTIFIGSEV